MLAIVSLAFGAMLVDMRPVDDGRIEIRVEFSDTMNIMQHVDARRRMDFAANEACGETREAVDQGGFTVDIAGKPGAPDRRLIFTQTYACRER